MKTKTKKKPGRPPQTKSECKVDSCDRPARTQGLCVSHYGQKRRGVKKLQPLRGPHGRTQGLPELENSIAVYSRVEGKRAKVLARYARTHGLSMYQLGSMLLGEWAETHAKGKPVFRPHEKLKLWEAGRVSR